ncbi:MAG: LytTR family DNA-binding domain-containing protein [Parabacteroides sp.]|nr:LytTR family DNA-binding domain-containing protein [Parabacteroides sp.]
MKTVLIEDEKAAVRNLTALLHEVAPGVEIVAVLDSITETVEWFSHYPQPELVFMDIHLADGSAFEIFDRVAITCPVIFTTAYDEYALRAFKVNSIDYLLKPIGEEDIRHALEKFELFRTPAPGMGEMRRLIDALKRATGYKTHFLVPVKGDKLMPVAAEEIRYFYIRCGVVKGVLADGREYVFPQTLDELADCLNPADFFRVNRQYLLARRAVRDIDLWFNGRLSVNLNVPVPERILVSKARVAEFKDWFA